jgi:hypothetical protein
MSAIRLYTDEDVFGVIAPALRRHGIDAVSTPETARLGESDESQLSWAANQGRVLITLNVGHFVCIHGNWLAQGRHHAGIIVSQHRTVGDLLRRVTAVAARLDAETMVNRLEFLSDW